MVSFPHSAHNFLDRRELQLLIFIIGKRWGIEISENQGMEISNSSQIINISAEAERHSHNCGPFSETTTI